MGAQRQSKQKKDYLATCNPNSSSSLEVICFSLLSLTRSNSSAIFCRGTFVCGAKSLCSFSNTMKVIANKGAMIIIRGAKPLKNAFAPSSL